MRHAILIEGASRVAAQAALCRCSPSSAKTNVVVLRGSERQAVIDHFLKIWKSQY
jgi:hypothetical protein